MKESAIQYLDSKTKHISIIACILFISSCSHFLKTENAPKPTPNYSATRDAHERSAALYQNFETLFQSNVVHLSPRMIAAMGEYHRVVFGASSSPELAPAGKTAFLVSLFSPTDDWMLLSDKKFWTILLTADESSEPLNPVTVNALRNKEYLKTFFPKIHNWSREFLVVFDTPPSSGDDVMVKKSAHRLELRSPRGTLDYKWP